MSEFAERLNVALENSHKTQRELATFKMYYVFLLYCTYSDI